ncbi:MAG: FHA domain-containing protein [Anaerolineales bacterium]|nr:FHA domain-containing protein [Anaerolineales bacterium]
MEQAVITLEYEQHKRRDLAVPITVSTRLLAIALARALDQPEGQHALVQRTPDGLHRLPPNATLSDMGILCGATLLLQVSAQTEEPAGSGAAFLKLDSGKVLLLEESSLWVGRSDPKSQIIPEVDLSSIDLRKYTSRRHSLITRTGSDYLLQDEASTNGTFVNGQRLLPRQPQVLQDGDVIEFGKAEKGGVRVTFRAGKD